MDVQNLRIFFSTLDNFLGCLAHWETFGLKWFGREGGSITPIESSMRRRMMMMTTTTMTITMKMKMTMTMTTTLTMILMRMRMRRRMRMRMRMRMRRRMKRRRRRKRMRSTMMKIRIMNGMIGRILLIFMNILERIIMNKIIICI